MDARIEDEILPTIRELGIGLVPYSPLGRGFLAGAVRGDGDLGAGDDVVPFPAPGASAIWSRTPPRRR